MEKYTNKKFCLEIWGDYACFTRPELKVERISYDVITPSAARNILQAIFWKPAIEWRIYKIEVLNPIKWTSVKRNEVAKTASLKIKNVFIEKERQQKSATILRDVRYRIWAELEFIPPQKRIKTIKDSKLENSKEKEFCHSDENPAKYNAMFERRASKGQSFTVPYFGCREFPANFRLVKTDEYMIPPIGETRDLGIMLFDMDFSDIKKPKAMFFKANMNSGVIDVPLYNSKEVLR